MANLTTDADTDAVVQLVHEAKLREFVPVIVVLSLLSLAGVVGNLFTVGFYGFHTKWTPTVLMITALALVDLFICVILIHAITEIALNVKYTNRVTCKIFHVLVHWAMGSSALILWLVSIDRFRRICRPLKKQIGLKLAKRLVIGVVVFACLISIRDFVNFDIIEFDVDTGDNSTVGVGHYCTTTDNPDLKLSVTVFLGVDALLIVTVLVTLVVTYCNVVMAICRRSRSALHGDKRHTVQVSDETSANNETDTAKSAVKSDPNVCETDMESCKTANNTKGSGKTVSSKTANMRKSERSITMLMLLVSVGFFVCFVPYFIIKIGIRSIKRASDLELGPGIQLAIRLVYVNSFLNPLIFCAFNPQFRKYVREVVSRCRVGTKYETEHSSQAELSTGKEQMSSE